MRIANSLRSLKKRDDNLQQVRRRGRIFLVRRNKLKKCTAGRYKSRQG
jgi:ribosomal protein L36